jgi:hypothetical protein
MEYSEHELQTIAPEAFLSGLYWSRLIETTGLQSRLTRHRSKVLMKAYCFTVPYFEADPERARKMILYFNPYLTVPVEEKELTSLIETGRRFYSRNKTNADKLMNIVAEGTGFDPQILFMHTISVLASLKGLEKDRKKAEEVLEQLEFSPLYKE